MQRIELALSDVAKMIENLEGRLKNQDFVQKAPAEIVDRERAKSAELKDRKKRLEENLQALNE